MGRLEPATFPQRLEAYFGPEAPGEPTAFAGDMREALERLLRRYGGEAFWVAAPAIEAARRRLIERFPDVLAAATESGLAAGARREPVARAAAAIAVVLAEARPIKGLEASAEPDEQPRHLLLSPNAYCALVIGLSIAMLTLGGEGEDADVVVGSADMAVDAAFARFSVALRARDAAGALANEFLATLPFLT